MHMGMVDRYIQRKPQATTQAVIGSRHDVLTVAAVTVTVIGYGIVICLRPSKLPGNHILYWFDWIWCAFFVLAQLTDYYYRYVKYMYSSEINIDWLIDMLIIQYRY